MHNDLEFEKEFWSDCCNTFGEDQKHYIYGNFMGLTGSYFSYDVQGKKILDIGGGPSSMLLKTHNLAKGKVCDPIDYPQWTKDRYAFKNIDVQVICGEDIDESGWDEVWIYNVMQHCEDPEKIIKNALKAAKMLRIFEWIDIPPHEGHPHMLTQKFLEDCIGQKGNVKNINGENGCYGKCFYGHFQT
jgi:hypothetical protein